jgi:hypothetical protein
VILDDLGETSPSAHYLAKRRRWLSCLLLGQVEDLAEFAAERTKPIRSDHLLIEGEFGDPWKFVVGKIEVFCLGFCPNDSCKAILKLILSRKFLLRR